MHINIFQNLHHEINNTLSITNEKWTVNKVFSQVVAGKILFYHATAADDAKYSITIFVPLPQSG